MKYPTVLGLAAVGVVGSIAVAAAQPPPTPAPSGSTAPDAPPADTTAPPTPPSTAPTAAPSGTTTAPPAPGAPGTPEPAAAEPQPAPPPAPAPVVTPPIQFGTPGADKVTPEAKKEEKKPNPFRFSWVTWNQTATTTIFGLGRDNIGSEDEEYDWEFTFTPRYYFYDKPENQAYVSAKLGVQTEMTNSNTTTYYREPLFEDLQVGTGYAHLFYQSRDKETKVYAGPTLTLIFPTSKISSSQGKYFSTALGVAPRGTFKLLGPDAKGLNNVTVSAGVTWSHLFARSYNPTNEDLNTPRQTATGSTFLSDQVDMKSFDMNRLKFSFGYFFPIYGDLYFANSWAFQDGFKHDYQPGGGSGCDVSIANNPCVQAERDPTRTLHGAKTTFDVSLSYDFFDTIRWDVGYQNETSQIGEDGQRRNVFYSPDAQFYMDIIVMLDGVLDKTHLLDKGAKKAALMKAGRAAY